MAHEEICPKCNSADIQDIEITYNYDCSQKIVHWKCHSCGHDWWLDAEDN